MPIEARDHVDEDPPHETAESSGASVSVTHNSSKTSLIESSDRSYELDDVQVSDVDSDVEPDQLIDIYIRTKSRLYEINPAFEDVPRKNIPRHTVKASMIVANGVNSTVQKLEQKLRKIQSDVLFDGQEAEAQWAAKKTLLARYTAEREKEEFSTSAKAHTRPVDAESRPKSPDEDLLDNSDEPEEDDLLGPMFTSLDITTSQPVKGDQLPNSEATSVHIRDFGRVTGMSPRRILEEACRARDPKCKVLFHRLSPTAWACRHMVRIDFDKGQGMIDGEYMKAIKLKSTPRQLVLSVVGEAAADITQSESYAATAALFVLFSGSTKEEKAHLKLPPAYRGLWDEFVEMKQNYLDAGDRETVKELRSMIEKHTALEDAPDDEVVFNAQSRRLNGSTNGTSTPVSRSRSPLIATDISESLKDSWVKVSSSPSYQRTLLQRMNLPIFHAKKTILQTISKNQVTIIVGDTGSGKSTQVPQFILENELSSGRNLKVYTTEPRRISAISLSQRVSTELGENKGDLGTARSLVGYAIRLESRTAPQTKLVYATVGIVLRMLENADALSEITHLILDEVHERSIDTDFLLIVLKSLVVKRPDLKVILMSATVDARKFSQYLDDAPIIEVSGRAFPVKSLFLEDAIELTGHSIDDTPEREETEDDSIEADDSSQSEMRKYLNSYSPAAQSAVLHYNEYAIDAELIVKLIDTVAQHQTYWTFSKAVLIFVPGIQEIRQLHSMLVGHPSFSQGWLIYPLHSTFSSDEQQAAFDIPPEAMRKIVIATNIAETGITIPDITCVIDTGKHREMRFDERRQMSRLTQSFVARANAKQRRGRAGRVQEGLCFHLFTRYRYEKLLAETQQPEMLRVSLQDLIMRVKICKLGDIEGTISQALDPPSLKTIRRAIGALIEVDALTKDEQLTSLGRQLAAFPLDAQLGKLLLYGIFFRCLDFALTVAATLTSKSPFLSPLHAKRQADTVRLGFKRGDSDVLTLFNAYKAWRKVCNTKGMSEYHFCNKNFLSPQNLANIEDLKRQLLMSVVDAGFLGSDAAALTLTQAGSRNKQRNFVSIPDKYCTADENDLITSSVVAWSFYPKIIKRDGKGWRNVANNQSLSLHPTSVNKTGLSLEVNYLSFYSVMQTSSKFANAQETTPVSDFALVLLAGDAVFHMYAGVIVIDGNRLRFKAKDWKTMLVLKTLRTKVRATIDKILNHPARPSDRRWVELVEQIFEQRNA